MARYGKRTDLMLLHCSIDVIYKLKLRCMLQTRRHMLGKTLLQFTIASRNRLPVAMDTEPGVETRLSRRLAQEDNDATALAPAQQESLDGHKV